MSSINRLESRSGIQQLRLDALPEGRLDGAPGNQVHPTSESPFELLAELDEAQSDGGIHLHQDVDVAVFPRVSSGPGTEQGQAPNRIARFEQLVLVAQQGQNLFGARHRGSSYHDDDTSFTRGPGRRGN